VQMRKRGYIYKHMRITISQLRKIINEEVMNSMGTTSKTGMVLNPDMPESATNPAIGGVFVEKRDPNAWTTITSIANDGMTFSARNSMGTSSKLPIDYYETAPPSTARYIPASSPEAMAKRKPLKVPPLAADSRTIRDTPEWRAGLPPRGMGR